MPARSSGIWRTPPGSFETFILETFDDDYRAFDPAFKVLYNSYYNTVGDKHPRPERGLLSRPSL